MIKVELSEEEAVGVFYAAKAGLAAARVMPGDHPLIEAAQAGTQKIMGAAWEELRHQGGQAKSGDVTLLGLLRSAQAAKRAIGREPAVTDSVCRGCEAEASGPDLKQILWATAKTIDGPQCDRHAYLRAFTLGVRCSFCGRPIESGLHRGAEVKGERLRKVCRPFEESLDHEDDPREEALTDSERNPGINEGRRA